MHRLKECIGFDTFLHMKPISFLGDSRKALQNFPEAARYRAGVELRAVQNGVEPDDWRPMRAVGAGVKEIRIRDASGAFRIIYLATLTDRILVLYAFQKKSQRTAQPDIDLAAKRLKSGKHNHEDRNLR